MVTNETVLASVKNSLPPMVAASGTAFDNELLATVDTCILTLAELGCIKDGIFQIGPDTEWSEILKVPPKVEETDSIYAAIRAYVSLSARIFFDPPVSGVTKIYESKIAELLYRIEVAYEYHI